jgi:hypothetical protein
MHETLVVRGNARQQAKKSGAKIELRRDSAAEDRPVKIIKGWLT